MLQFSTVEFTIFCLTVIALVAMVHRNDEIAGKAVSAIEKTVSTLSSVLQKVTKPREVQKK